MSSIVKEKGNIGTEKTKGKGLEPAVRNIMLLAAYAFTVLLILGGTMIHRKHQAKAPEPIPYAPLPEPMEPAALAALEAFFEAPDLAAKAALVYDSQRVRPMLEDFHGNRGHPFPTLGRVSPGQTANIDAKPMMMFEVEPFSGSRYFVAVVWDGLRFAVDWESLTAYGTMDWSEFIENKPAQIHTMRVFIREASHTDRPPGQAETTAFFLVEHRDHAQPLIAASDDLAQKLRTLAENKRTPVTLELIWKNPESGGVAIPWIKTIVAEGWSH